MQEGRYGAEISQIPAPPQRESSPFNQQRVDPVLLLISGSHAAPGDAPASPRGHPGTRGPSGAGRPRSAGRGALDHDFGSLKFAYVLLQTLSHFPEEAACDVALVIRGAGAERRAPASGPRLRSPTPGEVPARWDTTSLQKSLREGGLAPEETFKWSEFNAKPR